VLGSEGDRGFNSFGHARTTPSCISVCGAPFRTNAKDVQVVVNRLNVLFMACTDYVGLTFNLTRLAIALKDIGHKVIVLSSPGEEEKGLFEELDRRRIKYYLSHGLETLSVRNLLTAARTMANIINREDVDVIHAQGMRHLISAFLASKIFFRKKKIGLVASPHSYLAGTRYEKVTLLVESFLLNICADLALPVSKSVGDKLVAYGLVSQKVAPVYNGIDLKLLDETMRSARYSHLIPREFSRSSVILVGFFASLTPLKGHTYLIMGISRVSEEFPNVRLVIAGGGPMKGELERLSRRLGLEKKVLFTGKISHKSVYELLKRIDLYVFPSLAELFPFAVLEPMAACKPIVATKVGGVPEVIEDGKTGLLVPPRDYARLADGIKRLIRNPIEAEEMGSNCRKLIEERFTLHRIAHDLTECYELSIKRERAS